MILQRASSRSAAFALVAASLIAASTQASDAQAAPSRAASKVTLEFVKNAKDPSNSSLRVYNAGKFVTKYRAGSGLGTTADYKTKAGKRYRNDCASKAGWLPNGTYKPTSFQTNRDSDIKGYAIGLPNKECQAGGVNRTALFIHSEMTKDRKQGPKKGADSPRRWDGDVDYKSWGCIKLNPYDIARLFSYMNRHGRAASLTVR